MDNGEEIPGLNEDWTFGGAKLFEWIAGFMMMLIAAEVVVDNAGRSMPLLVVIMVITTSGLASLRRSFPDEERGVRNLAMVTCGFSPPGLPTPAALQPLWSGAPLQELNGTTHFMQLGLHEVFVPEESKDDDNLDPTIGVNN